MKKTISIMVGEGSLDHNRRKFIAENVDATRTPNNVVYCDENIRNVYHELFDEALRKYNAKQKRSDRYIKDYYEKIRTGHQEKPFTEMIVQVGNSKDSNATEMDGEIVKAVLDEYFRDFRKRNPNLRVIGAYLHMDEATPHLNIDFIPFTTGSKRGLETRVSMKKALEAQGFTGGTREETEAAQWAHSEKNVLAAVMERHGIEWEMLGTSENHLTVLNYKKKMRMQELEVLEEKVAQKTDELKSASLRIKNYEKGEVDIQNLEERLNNAPEYQLPEPSAMMSARSYKTKFADPLIKRLKALVKRVLAKCFEGWDNYYRLNITNGNLYRANERLQRTNELLNAENKNLKAQNKDYRLLRRVFGNKHIDNLLEQARTAKGKKRDERSR